MMVMSSKTVNGTSGRIGGSIETVCRVRKLGDKEKHRRPHFRFV